MNTSKVTCDGVVVTELMPATPTVTIAWGKVEERHLTDVPLADLRRLREAVNRVIYDKERQ